MPERKDEPQLPTASKHSLKSDEKQDRQKSSAGEAVSPVTISVAVISVRTKIRTTDAIRIPEGTEDQTENYRDCDEDQDGRKKNQGKHCVFSIRAHRKEIPGSPAVLNPVSQENKASQNELRHFREASSPSHWSSDREDSSRTTPQTAQEPGPRSSSSRR
jgi:hypothetical protein